LTNVNPETFMCRVHPFDRKAVRGGKLGESLLSGNKS
jgi:hypothetical protein